LQNHIRWKHPEVEIFNALKIIARWWKLILILLYNQLIISMKRSLLYLLFAIPFVTAAQSNFRKGYVLTNTVDTLKGYVNYRERSVNPTSVQFKPMTGAKVQTFTLKNSSGYTVDDVERFERYEVDISMSSNNVSSLSFGPDSSSRRDTVFLKVIQKGENVTLYGYRDNIKNRFYIKEKGAAVPVELVYERYLDPDNKGNIITAGKFGGQLLELLIKFNAGTIADSEKIRRIHYEEEDLSKISLLINKQKAEAAVQSKYSRTRLFAGSGISISNTAYRGDNELANAAATNKSSVSPILTAGMDLFANPAIGKLIYRVELSLVQSKNEISTTTDVQANARLSHTFNQYTAMVVPQLIYNIYNTDPLKIYLGAGFAMSFSKYSNNKSSRYNSFRDETTVTENQINFEAFSTSFPFRLGMVFSKRIEVVAIYMPTSSIANYNFFNIGVKRYTIGLNYLFGKH